MATANSTAANQTSADLDREIIELARQLEQRRQWVSQFKRRYLQTQCKDKAESGVRHG